jgi:hypothetical protein
VLRKLAVTNRIEAGKVGQAHRLPGAPALAGCQPDPKIGSDRRRTRYRIPMRGRPSTA